MLSQETGPERAQIQHIIFDFDGVLCNSMPLAIEIHNELRITEFRELPAIESQEEWTNVYRRHGAWPLNEWLSRERSLRFFERVSKTTVLRADRLHLFQGVEDLLGEIRGRCWSIVTAGPESIARRVLGKSSRNSIRHIPRIYGRETAATKERNLAELLDAYGLNPLEVVYVGDTEEDIVACGAEAIGMIGVGYGYCPRERLRPLLQKHFAETVPELHRILKTICRKSIWRSY